MKYEINVNYGEERGRHIERIAKAHNMSRTDFLRWTADEIIAADAKGLELFPTDRSGLTSADAAGMRASVMEMNRMTTEWAKHVSALRKQEHDDQLMLSKARAEFVEGIPERIGAALDPFRAELEQLTASIHTQPRLDAIEREQAALRSAQEGYTAAIGEYTKALKRVVRHPRTQYALVLGDDRVWSTAFIVGWSAVMMVLGALMALFALR